MNAIAKPRRIDAAVWLLYGASLLGILELFTTSAVTGVLTTLYWLDIIVYVCLGILAFIIGNGIGPARILYGITAFIWFFILIFYLPPYFNHGINTGLIFIQLLLIIAALYILYQPKSVKWFNSVAAKK